ncbi:hypothetical protein ACU686_06685 [Yinghuangia aomiensis]
MFVDPRELDADKLYRGGTRDLSIPPGRAARKGRLARGIDQIPQPDRRVDTDTIWVPHFDRGYFRNLFLGDGSTGASLATHSARSHPGG